MKKRRRTGGRAGSGVRRSKLKFNLLLFLLVFLSALFIILALFFIKEFIIREISLAPANTINIVDCGTLDQADTEYVLQNDVTSSADCFIIRANDIVLNGQGFKILFNTGGLNDNQGIRVWGANNTVVKDLKLEDGTVDGKGEFGVYVINANNTLIQNLDVKAYNASAIYISESNFTTAVNNILNSSSNGIQIISSSFGNFLGNNIFTFVSAVDPQKFNRAIYLLSGSSENRVSDNNVTTVNDNGHGIQVQDSSNNRFYNNYVRTYGNSADALRIIGGITSDNEFNNNLFITYGAGSARGLIIGGIYHSFSMSDAHIEALDAGSNDIEVSSQSTGGIWNFTDVGFFDSNSVVRFSDVLWNTNGLGTMNVHWKFNTVVVDSSDNYIQGVLVRGKNVFGTEIFSLTTDSNGQIGTQNLLEFQRIDGGSPIIYTDYTINYSKSWYVSSGDLINFVGGNKLIQKQLSSTGGSPGPSINILSPLSQSYSTNISLGLNYIASSSVGLGACKYNFDHGANVTAACNLNNTFNISEGSHTLYVFATDLDGNSASFSISFQINLGMPSVLLISPEDNLYLNYKNDITFVHAPDDAGSLVSCSLYGNFNGNFVINQTDNVIIKGAQNNFIPLNLSEGVFKWNVLCRDNDGNEGFAFRNYTLGIDTINPIISNITSPAAYPLTTLCSRTVDLRYDIIESNKNYCVYSVSNGTSNIISDVNLSSCGSDSFTISSANEKKNLIITLSIFDKAGHNASLTMSFYVDSSLSSCSSGNQTATTTTTTNPGGTNVNRGTQRNDSINQGQPPQSGGNAGAENVQKISIVENASSVSVKDGEKIIFSLNGKDYDAVFEVNSGVVSLNIGSGSYSISEGEVVSVLVGESKVYFGAKDIKSTGASLLVGLSEKSVKSSIKGKASTGQVAYILMIAVLVILIGVIVTVIYYVLRVNRQVEDRGDIKGVVFSKNQENQSGMSR